MWYYFKNAENIWVHHNEWCVAFKTPFKHLKKNGLVEKFEPGSALDLHSIMLPKATIIKLLIIDDVYDNTKFLALQNKR